MTSIPNAIYSVCSVFSCLMSSHSWIALVKDKHHFTLHISFKHGLIYSKEMDWVFWITSTRFLPKRRQIWSRNLISWLFWKFYLINSRLMFTIQHFTEKRKNRCLTTTIKNTTIKITLKLLRLIELCVQL